MIFFSGGLYFWSVNYNSIYENAELKVFKNIKFLGETSNNRTNDLLVINIYKAVESCWYSLSRILQGTNITSRISKWDIFYQFHPQLSYF